MQRLGEGSSHSAGRVHVQQRVVQSSSLGRAGARYVGVPLPPVCLHCVQIALIEPDNVRQLLVEYDLYVRACLLGLGRIVDDPVEYVSPVVHARVVEVDEVRRAGELTVEEVVGPGRLPGHYPAECVHAPGIGLACQGPVVYRRGVRVVREHGTRGYHDRVRGRIYQRGGSRAGHRFQRYRQVDRGGGLR